MRFVRRSRYLGAGVALAGALLLLLSACGGSSAAATSTATPQPVTLTVFAASSLKAAFTKIGQQYQAAHPNVTVNFSFGGSDALAAQINQGAPADVFASANTTQMNVVVKAGNIDASTVQTFAHNRLVVIVPKANPANIQTLQDLAKSGIRLDLAAATVPAGQYAVTFLTKASADPSFSSSYKADVLKNVVSYETDVATVLNKVSLGEADAGIVYTTDAQTAASTVTTIAIPDALNTIAVYPIAAVKSSANAATASAFVTYVSSSAGQAVLASYGFLAGSAGTQYTPPTS
jgi:molybdate transport system substrate-binding protein